MRSMASGRKRPIPLPLGSRPIFRAPTVSTAMMFSPARMVSVLRGLALAMTPNWPSGAEDGVDDSEVDGEFREGFDGGPIVFAERVVLLQFVLFRQGAVDVLERQSVIAEHVGPCSWRMRRGNRRPATWVPPRANPSAPDTGRGTFSRVRSTMS